MAEYRIVTDRFNGYEVQRRTWWWPFWRQVGVNTHVTINAAEQFARRDAGTVVKYLGDLNATTPDAGGGRD